MKRSKGSISPVLASTRTCSSSRLPPVLFKSPSLASFSQPLRKNQISLTSRLFDSSSDLSPQLYPRRRNASVNRLNLSRPRNTFLDAADSLIDTCEQVVRTRKQPTLRKVENEIKAAVSHIMSLGKVRRPVARQEEEPAISKRQLAQLINVNKHMRLRSWHEFL